MFCGAVVLPAPGPLFDGPFGSGVLSDDPVRCSGDDPEPGPTVPAALQSDNSATAGRFPHTMLWFPLSDYGYPRRGQNLDYALHREADQGGLLDVAADHGSCTELPTLVARLLVRRDGIEPSPQTPRGECPEPSGGAAPRPGRVP